MKQKRPQSHKVTAKAPKPVSKAHKAPQEALEQAEDPNLLRYWEKHMGTKLTHYLSFAEFKAGWLAAYAYNEE